jgi:hypothetical protein
MDSVILRKWLEFKDAIGDGSPSTEEYDKVAALVAAVLTLADEVRKAGLK